MKLAILTLVLISSLTSKAFAEAPMLKAVVSSTEDRWIHFPDGNKVRHGMEVTHMLNQQMFDSGMFRIQIPQASEVGLEPIVIDKIGSNDRAELEQRLPNYNIDYVDHKNPNIAYDHRSAHMLIRPKVHTLLYSSGKRSNRVVYGFSPDRLNPFNSGNDVDSLDNDFTVRQFDEVGQCSTLDFFDGQLKTRGWAHKRSNYGADADEGFSFEIFGFGVSFKKKAYAIKLGIEFEVYFPEQNLTQKFNYEFKAKGTDLSVGASYAGIHLGFEQQRRFTMRNALEEGLPKLLSEFINDMPKNLWQAPIKQGITGDWQLNYGSLDGMQTGFAFEAANGNQYVVNQVFDTHSVVAFSIANPTYPKDGEIVRFVSEPEASPWNNSPGIRSVANFDGTMTTKLSAASFGGLNLPGNTLTKKIEAELSNTTSPSLVEKRIGNCAEKKHSWFERLVMAIMTFYANWRFDNVYDQEFPQTAKSEGVRPMVALISSGVYPREKGLEKHISNSGFDFISWDNRPSDDLGVGTAAAKRLASQSRADFELVPVKVFGAHGETHSSAVYGAMDWVSKRSDIDIVLVPWIPGVKSRAYKEGLRKMVASGKTVIAPEGTGVFKIVSAKKARGNYKTKGIRKAKLQLSPEGVGVVDLGAEYIEKWTYSKGEEQ